VKDHVIELPRPYHEAILHWQRHNFPDYPLLAKNWERYFAKDPPFCLCAKLAQDVSDSVEVGDRKGQPKALRPSELEPEAGQALLEIIRAQASTEFGSIQQHQDTLDRAQDDEDRMWVLRVMAEELRHGYQMIHLLTSADWSPITPQKPADMVEDILSMQTGSHVLAAFNLEYDSFVDNVVFCAFIDRVGKYQLSMQRVCTYKPFAASMPPMLREEAFHLASGVIPMRRWVEKAARGEPYVTMEALQKAVHKWFPRGLEMFGHEKGGDTNVRLGIKDMANGEAQRLFVEECQKMLDDLNRRYTRAVTERGGKVDDTELLRLPDSRFFRRRGEPAFQMIGVNGETFTDVDGYLAHLGQHLPDAYLASKDVKHYADTLRKVVAGELSLKDAIRSMPRLERGAGTCSCANSVRWVVDAPETAVAQTA
jgi:1,2-phenylacetyl-CoA epoxidase catalytic subunit